ncbi:MAG: hypothetical protein ABW167_13200 [Baekduia sp.]
MDLSNIKQLRAAAAEVVELCDTARDLDRVLCQATTTLWDEIDVLRRNRAAEEQAEMKAEGKGTDRIRSVMTPFGPGIVVSLSSIIPGLRADPAEKRDSTPEAVPEPSPEAGGEPEQIEPTPTFLSDRNGVDLFVGDRVLVRDSSRFGEVQGNVTGTQDGRLVIDLDISTSTVLRDASHEEFDVDFGKGYTSSLNRVTRLAGQTAAFAGG